MSFVTWTHDLETGIADVDAQHLVLVDHINKFHDAFQSNNFVDTKNELRDLIDYTAFHFGEEEKMLEAAQYHMLEPHKKVHANFVKRMTDMQERYENGDHQAAQELVELLDGWLFRHIRLNDHGYVEHVKKSGVV